MAQMPMADFITHVSRLGIPVITHEAHEVTRDMDTLDQWLATSFQTVLRHVGER